MDKLLEDDLVETRVLVSSPSSKPPPLLPSLLKCPVSNEDVLIRMRLVVLFLFLLTRRVFFFCSFSMAEEGGGETLSFALESGEAEEV